MRSVLAIPAALTLLATAASAQTPAPASAPTWQRVIETERHRGEVKDMVIADNGDIVVVGFLPGKQGNYDGWAARFDITGKQLWSTLLGGRARDEALSVALGKDGAVFVAGWTDNGGMFDEDGWVAKLSGSGETAWFKTFDLPDIVAVSEVHPLPDGGVIALGHHATGKGVVDLNFAVRLKADGSTSWTYDPAASTPIPATRVVPLVYSHGRGSLLPNGDLEIRGEAGNDSSCIVLSLEIGKPRDSTCMPHDKSVNNVGERIGAFLGGSTSGYYLSDVVFRKYDTSGKVVWERVLNTPDSDGVERIALTPDGGVIGAGFLLDGPGPEFENWNGLLIKLDSDGNVLWRRKYGGSKRDELRNVAVLKDGSIVAAGYTGSQGAYEWTPWILHLNADGELEGAAKAELESKQH